MTQSDPIADKILMEMQKLLAESRLLKQRHDELIEKYLKLKREFEKRTGTQHDDSAT